MSVTRVDDPPVATRTIRTHVAADGDAPIGPYTDNSLTIVNPSNAAGSAVIEPDHLVPENVERPTRLYDNADTEYDASHPGAAVLPHATRDWVPGRDPYKNDGMVGQDFFKNDPD